MSLPEHLESVAAQCIAMLDAMQDSIIASQELYRSQVGNYCQLLNPHDSTPVDGVPAVCDWDRYASDVGLSWASSDIGGLLPESLPCSPRCDIWCDDAGHWFAVTLLVASSVTGKEYRYTRIYNASGLVEARDWQEVEYVDV